MTRRFVLAFLALTVLVLVVLIVPLGITAATRERDRLTLDLERDARTIGAFAEDTLEGIADEDLQAAADQYAERTGARALILNERGRVVADSDPVAGATNYRSRPEVASALEGQLAAGTRRSDTLDTDLLYVAVPVASGGEVHGVVRLTYPTTAVDQRVRRVWLTLGGVAVVSLVAAGAIAAALARSVTRPLRELQAAATALGGGDLSAHAPDDHGPPEVRALAKAFNDTSRRLEELMGAQDAFVADASHQLRTPLTALRLRLENLEAGAAPEDAAELGAALDESNRLSRLVDGLLALAGADRAAAMATAVPVALGPVLEERRDIWLPVAEDRGVDLVVAPGAALTALATPDRLTQVLDNLVDNALEVAPSGTTIRLTMVRTPTGPAIHVQDQGPGMTPDQRERAFDRFWQGPEGTGSSGLGLAIVQKLVQADGGHVELHEAPEGGLDAVVQLHPAPEH
ncbi:MAG TPA: ATP-binding protein [Acidimicrobiales bacterium]